MNHLQIFDGHPYDDDAHGSTLLVEIPVDDTGCGHGTPTAAGVARWYRYTWGEGNSTVRRIGDGFDLADRCLGPHVTLSVIGLPTRQSERMPAQPARAERPEPNVPERQVSADFEARVAQLLGPRYCWAIHTEPVRILMQALEAAEERAEQAETLAADTRTELDEIYERSPDRSFD